MNTTSVFILALVGSVVFVIFRLIERKRYDPPTSITRILFLGGCFVFGALVTHLVINLIL